MKFIFLHGLGQTPFSWNETINNLSSKDDIICLDLFKLNNNFNYKNLYEEFSNYCESFKSPINICGLSLGGIIALNYAIKNPKKVNSLILIGTQYKMPKLLINIQNLVFKFMKKSSFEQIGIEKDSIIKLSKSVKKLNFTKDLCKISCPTLILCGEKDFFNKIVSVKLNKLIVNSEIKFIEKSGHTVNTDNPKMLATFIESFYAKI